MDSRFVSFSNFCEGIEWDKGEGKSVAQDSVVKNKCETMQQGDKRIYSAASFLKTQESKMKNRRVVECSSQCDKSIVAIYCALYTLIF